MHPQFGATALLRKQANSTSSLFPYSMKEETRLLLHHHYLPTLLLAKQANLYIIQN